MIESRGAGPVPWPQGHGRGGGLPEGWTPPEGFVFARLTRFFWAHGGAALGAGLMIFLSYQI